MTRKAAASEGGAFRRDGVVRMLLIIGKGADFCAEREMVSAEGVVVGGFS
jgi:hypothetical protein